MSTRLPSPFPPKPRPSCDLEIRIDATPEYAAAVGSGDFEKASALLFDPQGVDRALKVTEVRRDLLQSVPRDPDLRRSAVAEDALAGHEVGDRPLVPAAVLAVEEEQDGGVNDGIAGGRVLRGGFHNPHLSNREGDRS